MATTMCTYVSAGEENTKKKLCERVRANTDDDDNSRSDDEAG